MSNRSKALAKYPVVGVLIAVSMVGAFALMSKMSDLEGANDARDRMEIRLLDAQGSMLDAKKQADVATRTLADLKEQIFGMDVWAGLEGAAEREVYRECIARPDGLIFHVRASARDLFAAQESCDRPCSLSENDALKITGIGQDDYTVRVDAVAPRDGEMASLACSAGESRRMLQSDPLIRLAVVAGCHVKAIHASAPPTRSR